MALTEKQLAERHGLVTSSVVAGCIGRSKRMSPLRAYCLIRREVYHAAARSGAGMPPTGNAEIDRLGGNVYTQRGDDLEPLVLAWGARTLGCTWERAPFVRHKRGWSGDSCDALYHDEATGEVYLAEAKTAGAYESEGWGQQMSADIPVDYRIQCHWHLIHHEGVDVCYQPFLGGYDLGYRMYCVERNVAYERQLWAEARAFYREHIVPGVPPPVTDLDTDYLLAKWPLGIEGHAYEPTPEMDDMAEAAVLWRNRRDAADKKYHAATNVIRELLEDHASCASERYIISYRNNKDSEKTDWQALAMELGATDKQIIQHTHTRPGPRVLRLTGRGDLKKKKDAKK